MISKESFSVFVQKVKDTQNAIRTLENSLQVLTESNMSLITTKISSLVNFTPEIAFALLGNEAEEMDNFDVFYEDFCYMLNHGCLHIEIMGKDITDIYINSWDEFYDFWKKGGKVNE